MLTLMIFAMGIGTVALSCWAAVLFYRVRKGQLSKALTWQLLGEALMGAITMAFAAGAHFGWLDHWSINTQSAMRFFMFAATSLTTLHLVRVIQRL